MPKCDVVFEGLTISKGGKKICIMWQVACNQTDPKCLADTSFVLSYKMDNYSEILLRDGACGNATARPPPPEEKRLVGRI
jgi:hypothetical protein